MFKELSLLALLLGYAACQQLPMALLYSNLFSGGSSGGSSGGAAFGGASPLRGTASFGSTGEMSPYGTGAHTFRGRSAGTASTGGGIGGIFGRILNNPMILCRRTNDFQPVPCRFMRQMCGIVSMQTYGFPGLLKCSPMGFGCCLKDMNAMMMAQFMN